MISHRYAGIIIVFTGFVHRAHAEGIADGANNLWNESPMGFVVMALILGALIAGIFKLFSGGG